MSRGIGGCFGSVNNTLQRELDSELPVKRSVTTGIYLMFSLSGWPSVWS